VCVPGVVSCKGAFSLHWVKGLPRTGLGLRLIWIWTLDPFSLQINPSRSRITLEPINGLEPVYPETATTSCSWLQKQVNSLFNSFITDCLSFQCNFMLLVEWILREIKQLSLSNDPSVKLEMNEHCQVIRERPLDWLMSWTSEADQTCFVSGRQTVGRPKKHPRSIGQSRFT